MSRGNLIALLDGPSRWGAAEPAVMRGDTVLHTWASFGAAVARRGAALREQLGVRPGDAVAVFAPNSAEYLELMFAVWHAGAVVVPISSRLHVREAGALLAASHARVCFVSESVAEGLADSAPEACAVLVIGDALERSLTHGSPTEPVPRELGDDAWIFFTSGTTGTPRGARLSHGNLLAMTAAYYADVDAVGPCDRLLHIAALSHASGLFALPFVALHAVLLEPILEIGLDRHVRIQRVILEDHGDVAATRRDVRHALVTKVDGPARRPLQPRDQLQRRRLPAAAWTEQGDELARRNQHVGNVHDQRVLAEHLLESFQAHVRAATHQLGHHLAPIQNFTAPAPAPRPRTRRLWTKVNRSTTGSANTTVAAINGPHSKPMSFM